jgi:hypothetical protein
MTKQELDRLAANNRKKFEQFVVRMIVNFPDMTYAEIGHTVGLNSVTEVGRIAKKHSVRRPKGFGSPAYKLRTAPKYGTTGLLHFDAPFPPAIEWKRMSSDEQDAWREEHMVRGGK